MQNITRIALGLGAAAVVASTGSAFTAGAPITADNIAGYHSATVTGAALTTVEHTLNADGTAINSTSLTFTTPLSNSASVKAAFGTAALRSCTPTGVGATTFTGANCDYTTTGGAFVTASENAFHVAVS